MVNMELLKDKIKSSGMTMTAISNQSGMLKATLYNRLKGIGDFTVTEACSLGKVLHLTDKELKQIFLA